MADPGTSGALRSGGTASGAAPDAVMVFDGLCHFCSTTVRLVSFMDSRGLVRFSPVQSPYGRDLCRRSGVDPDDPTTFLFFDAGRPLAASDGMIALVARLEPPWRWLVILGLIPRTVREAAYRWLARHRYQLFGRRRACLTPSAGLRARFIHDPPAA